MPPCACHQGRLRAGRLLFHDQPAHPRARGRASGSRSSGSGWTPSSSSTAAAPSAASCARSGSGDRVVCGLEGIRVTPEFRDRTRADFGFMTNEISSERRVEASVGRIASMMRDTRARGLKIAFVAGPVVVHTGGGAYFIELDPARLRRRRSWRATRWPCTTPSRRCSAHRSASTSRPARRSSGGHRHHMRAINAINAAGGIRGAVDAGVLQGGVMVECVRAGVRYVLAGSIRDDGPIVDTRDRHRRRAGSVCRGARRTSAS